VLQLWPRLVEASGANRNKAGQNLSLQ